MIKHIKVLIFPILYGLIGILVFLGLMKPYLEIPMESELQTIVAQLAKVTKSSGKVELKIKYNGEESTICKKVWVKTDHILNTLSDLESPKEVSILTSKNSIGTNSEKDKCLVVYELKAGEISIIGFQETKKIIYYIQYGLRAVGLLMFLIGIIKLWSYIKSNLLNDS